MDRLTVRDAVFDCDPGQAAWAPVGTTVRTFLVAIPVAAVAAAAYDAGPV
jgi:hypothetical protein